MIEVFVPRENLNDDTAIIRSVHYRSGSLVKKGQVIVEIETSKTNIDIESPLEGTLSHTLRIGDEVDVGTLLFKVGDIEAGKEFTELQQEPLSSTTIKISKAARKRADELGISLDEIKGEWITVEDVEKKAGVFSKKITDQTHAPNDLLIEDNSFSLIVPLVRERIPKRKQLEVKNLLIGNHHSTSSTIGIEIVVPGRRVVDAPYLFQDSISDLIVYEGSKLLIKYPELNATYIDSEFFGKYENINFGWSFDSGSNLKVLAIKNSNQMSLTELQLEVERLLQLYESNANIPADLLTSSTVTFSDLSRTDATFIYPLINGHQSMILGVVSKSQNNYSIYATFDHRVSEGLRVANFLTELKRRILSYYRNIDGVVNLVCCACEKSIKEELSLRNRGFIKITLPNGSDANLCRNCFEGW